MDLSVAIIFKNEIRCIERCLRSLQPLKERVSCEIVMADTGSDDGSRAVAERYADVVFDFPWINDFSAARNAVLDRCSGTWALSIDCDEWLDADVDELAAFVRDKEMRIFSAAGVLLRSYAAAELEQYTEVLLMRMLRLGAKPRYEGAIHESPVFAEGNGQSVQLPGTVLHHDGYVMFNDGSEEGAAKRARNIALLRAEMDKEPDGLLRLMQYLESAGNEEDYLPTLRRAISLVRGKREGWRRLGPAILRYAVFCAYNRELPELEEWTGLAQEMFPQSYYTRIDVMFIRFVRALVRSDCRDAITCGEAFLTACAEFRNDEEAFIKTDAAPLQRSGAYWAQYVRFRLAEAYGEDGRAERALELLRQTDWARLDARHTRYLLEQLGQLEKAGCDIRPLLRACREGLDARRDARAEECRAVFRALTGAEQAPSEELLRLAARVKALLDRLPPDDLAAAELKNSAAYQKVAPLLEGGAV